MDILDKAREEATSKLAAYGVTTVGQLRPVKRRKRRKKLRKGEAIIMPEEQTPDFWASPAGAYLRGGTLGAGTTASLGYALGGLHWSGRTPLFKKTKDVAKIMEAAKSNPLAKAKMSRIVRGLALGGAATGAGLTALYRHKAKKRQKELAKLPKQLVVKIPASIKTGAKIEAPKIKAPKLKGPKKFDNPAKGVKQPPGPTQKDQAIKITSRSVTKTAQERARKILERL